MFQNQHQQQADSSDMAQLSSITSSPHKEIYQNQLIQSIRPNATPMSNIDTQIMQMMDVVNKLNQVSSQARINNDQTVFQQQAPGISSTERVLMKSQSRNAANLTPLRKFLTIQGKIKKSPSSQRVMIEPDDARSSKSRKQIRSPMLRTQVMIKTALMPLKSPLKQTLQKSISTKSMKLKKTPSKVSVHQEEFLNQDLVSRLFINHKRQQEVKDQKRYIQRQKEMFEVKDRPSISPRSRELALNSIRFQKPINSAKRYKLEIDRYVSKKEEAARMKYMQQREKEIAEDLEMRAGANANHTSHQMDRTDFLRKYNNQVRMWESRTQPKFEEESEEQQPFKPSINKKSKLLARDMQRIDVRASKLMQDKQRNIEIKLQAKVPSFTPVINKNSERIANEGRKSLVEMFSPHPSKFAPFHYEISKPVLNRPRSALLIAKTDITPDKKLSSSKRHKVKMNDKSKNIDPIQEQEDFSLISKSIPPKQIISNLQSQEWNHANSLNMFTAGSPQKESTIIAQDSHHSSEDDQMQQDYVNRILQNTQNLNSYFEAQYDATQSQEMNEYLKLKQELDQQIANRDLKPIASQQYFRDTSSNSKAELFSQIERVSNNTSKTILVDNQYSSYTKDGLINQISSESFQTRTVIASNNDEDDKSYAIDFAGTLGPTPQQHNINDLAVQSESYVSRQLSDQLYRSSLSVERDHYTITSSADTKTGAELNISNLQPFFDVTKHQGALYGNQVKNSQEIVEVEQILANIRQSIDQISSQMMHGTTFKVDEEDKESSFGDYESEVAFDEDEIEQLSSRMQANKTSEEELEQPTPEQCSHKEIKECWNQALVLSPGKDLKNDTSYLKIIKEKTLDDNSERQVNIVIHRKSPTQQQMMSHNLEPLSIVRTSLQSGFQPTLENPVSEIYQSNSESTVEYNLDAWSSPETNLHKVQYNILEVAHYVDSETRQFLMKQKDVVQVSGPRHDEVVQRLIQSNKKNFGYDSITSRLSIPQDVMQEIEEFGLDTVSIIKAVIAKFQHVLAQSRVVNNNEVSNQYKTGTFITFNN